MNKRSDRNWTDAEEEESMLGLGLGLGRRRRKIRKGTRSCWACKRRKVRCSFPSAKSQACTHCQRRGSQCVGQDVPEELVPTDDSDTERVVVVASASGSISTSTGSLGTTGPGSTTRYAPGVLTPSSTNASPEGRDEGRQRVVGLTPHWVLGAAMLERKDLHEVSRALLSVYPPRRELEELLEKLQQDRPYSVLRNVRPSDVLLNEAAPVSDFLASDLQHPSADTHPVLIAHQMLLLVVMLQQVSKYSDPESRSSDQLELIERLFGKAVSLVTTNEALHGSVESLECLMMESLYLANLGSLHESWRANRRAMLVAQQMGLHRTGAGNRRFKRLDPRTPVHRENLWFRLLYYDRSQCLMLGLPQGSADDNTPRDAARLDPLDRLDRAHASIAARLLQRHDGHDLSEVDATTLTRELDAELLLAAKAMPLKFWLLAVFADRPQDPRHAFLDLWRSTTQVFHFNLINQLHLPGLLRFGRDSQSEHSRLACMGANREVLTRYLAYRTSLSLATSCLTFDFLSLMAAITLLLGHLHAHLRGAAAGALEHQRLCDLITLEQVLDTMKTVFHTSKNAAMSQSSINMLRCLLGIEEDAAGGGRYTAQYVRQPGSALDDDDDDETGGLSDHNTVLRICIPYFGLVRIMRVRPTDTNDDGVHQGHSRLDMTPAVRNLASGMQLQQNQTSQPLLYELPVPPSMDMEAYEADTWDELSLQQYWDPNIITGADDWDFQGVNLDIFDSR